MKTSIRNFAGTLERVLAGRIGEPRFRLWFGERTKFSQDGDRLVVGVPNCFFGEYLQEKFGEALRAAGAEVLGQPIQLHFTIDPELFQAARRAEAETRNGVSEPAVSPNRANKPPATDETATPLPPAVKRKRRWHHLNDFVVGPCNRLAHAAALSIVEAPGQGANPLVLHGPVGTGKTHLLEGIYCGLGRNHPGGRVVFVAAEEFTTRFVGAVRTGKLASFRKYHRECDALLLDDLNFLAGKPATAEAFLHTLDALVADGKQVVATCDCHPRLADEFSPELADRLLGGAVWGLEPPDPETRLTLFRARAAGGTPVVPDEVIRYLAQELRGNARELLGALHSIRHVSRVTGRAIDVAVARETLAELIRHSVRVVQLTDIDRAVCGALRLETGALQSKQRTWAVSHPRMLAMYLARKHTRASYSEVGQHFGGRNHSTAVAAERKVRQWLQTDGELSIGSRSFHVRQLIERIERELQR